VTLLHDTGSSNVIGPPVGDLTRKGLGTEDKNLLVFVTISPSMGNGGPRNGSNAFLPAAYQGTAVGRAGIPAVEAQIRNLPNPGLPAAEQRRAFDLLQELNAEQSRRAAGDSALEAVIGSY